MCQSKTQSCVLGSSVTYSFHQRTYCLAGLGLAFQQWVHLPDRLPSLAHKPVQCLHPRSTRITLAILVEEDLWVGVSPLARLLAHLVDSFRVAVMDLSLLDALTHVRHVKTCVSNRHDKLHHPETFRGRPPFFIYCYCNER